MKKKTIKENLIAFLHDGAICVLGGVIIAVGLGLVIALISGLVSGFDLNTVLNAVRSGLLIVGSILLFVVAGAMLGQKSNNKIRSSQKWKATFELLGPTFVFLIMAVAVLLIASIVDYIVWLS